MQDAILNRSLRLTIIGTISIAALIGLLLGYHGLFDLLRADWMRAASSLAWAFAAAAASLLLIRYRADLIDD